MQLVSCEKEAQNGPFSREGNGTHRRKLWLCRSRPRPDPRLEQEARRPLALRSVRRQRRRQAGTANFLARYEATGTRKRQARQAIDQRRDQAKVLLRELVKPDCARAESTRPA